MSTEVRSHLSLWTTRRLLKASTYKADDAQQQQPIWNTYHQPKPYSEFIRLSTLEDNDNSTIPVEDAPLIDAQERNTRKRSYSQHDSTIASPSTNTNSKTGM